MAKVGKRVVRVDFGERLGLFNDGWLGFCLGTAQFSNEVRTGQEDVREKWLVAEAPSPDSEPTVGRLWHPRQSRR